MELNFSLLAQINQTGSSDWISEAPPTSLRHSPLIRHGETGHLCVVTVDEDLNDEQTEGADGRGHRHPGCSDDAQFEPLQHQTPRDDPQSHCRQVQYACTQVEEPSDGDGPVEHNTPPLTHTSAPLSQQISA